MQWLRKSRDEDPAEFWRQTAEKRGGAIGFLTYASLMGRSSDQVLDLPGLLYTVGDTIWFEDFERDNWLSRLISSRKQFEKTELSFEKTAVRYTRLVSRSAAARCIIGALSAEKLSSVTFLGRFISTPIAQVALTDDSSLFFDVMRRKEFLALFAKEK
ncbi:MAG: hypothetical protein ABSF77_04380 [Spirochaetia bacterium]|jgi:hypothetical protein